MSRRARERAAAIEAKRIASLGIEFYLGPEDDDEDNDEDNDEPDGEGNTTDARLQEEDHGDHH